MFHTDSPPIFATFRISLQNLQKIDELDRLLLALYNDFIFQIWPHTWVCQNKTNKKNDCNYMVCFVQSLDVQILNYNMLNIGTAPLPSDNMATGVLKLVAWSQDFAMSDNKITLKMNLHNKKSPLHFFQSSNKCSKYRTALHRKCQNINCAVHTCIYTQQRHDDSNSWKKKKNHWHQRFQYVIPSPFSQNAWLVTSAFISLATENLHDKPLQLNHADTTFFFF